MTGAAKPPPRRPGRPRKGTTAPDYKDRALVLLIDGEIVKDEQGQPYRHWPTHKDIAERLGVQPSTISVLSSKHSVGAQRREREEACQKKTPHLWRDPVATQKEHALERKTARDVEKGLPVVELRRLLVHGEERLREDGTLVIEYPTQEALAKRYHVKPERIGVFARRHECKRLRREAQARLAAKTDERIAELRAKALVVDREETVRIIDELTLMFRDEMRTKELGIKNISDFNVLIRLKEFVLGHADSRVDQHTTLSLESVQDRHTEMMAQVRELPSGVTGIVEGRKVLSKPVETITIEDSFAQAAMDVEMVGDGADGNEGSSS